MVTGVILQAREQRIRKLVVVGSGLTGFDSPSLSERHWMVRQWVDASNGIVRLAMVVSGDLIDPDKFAVVAAANFGFTAEVFTCERDALKWLRELQ